MSRWKTGIPLHVMVTVKIILPSNGISFDVGCGVEPKFFAVEGSSTHIVCVEYTGTIRGDSNRGDSNRMEVIVEWCFLAKI